MNTLTPKEYIVYRYLEQVYEQDKERWVSKEEIIAALPELFNKQDETSHDVCSTLNAIRLRLNENAYGGKINHITLLKNNQFKLAKDREEIETYCKRDLENAMKLLSRYWHNIGVAKRDGQGKLIDCRGNVITDESLAKRFYTPFGE